MIYCCVLTVYNTLYKIVFHYFCSKPYVSTFLNLGSKALFNNFFLSHTPFTQPLTLRPICTVHLNNETLGCVCVNMQRSLDSECSGVRWEKEGSLVEVVPPLHRPPVCRVFRVYMQEVVHVTARRSFSFQ